MQATELSAKDSHNSDGFMPALVIRGDRRGGALESVSAMALDGWRTGTAGLRIRGGATLPRTAGWAHPADARGGQPARLV